MGREPHTAEGPTLHPNLLLVIRAPEWRDAAQLQPGRTVHATAPEDAIRLLLRPYDPFTHVLVEADYAGEWLPEIASLTAQLGGVTSLILLGSETQASLGVAALRARHPAELAALVMAPRAVARNAPLSAADIVEALDAGRVECQFQPIVRLSDGAPVGFEALARLQHALRGTLTPDWFVPQMETAGLSMRLTEAVLRASMGALERGYLDRTAMFLTVNLPLDVLLLPESLALVESYRQGAGIAVESIFIELTESRPVFDVPALDAALRRWRLAGYRLAIDDLGPEMINQTDLFDLPFHLVKLDKAIVLRSRDNRLAQSYLRRTIANAQARALRIIAEGVEDGEAWVQMRELGVDYAQGFLIARAMPAAALEAWRAEWTLRREAPGGIV